MDAAIARLALVALRQLGNKDVQFKDFLPFPVVDEVAEEKRRRVNRRPSKSAGAGLDPEIYKAFGVAPSGVKRNG